MCLLLFSTRFQYRLRPCGNFAAIFSAAALADASVYFTSLVPFRQISSSLFALYFSIAAFSYYLF